MIRNACLAVVFAIALGLSSAACENGAQPVNPPAAPDVAVYSEMSPAGQKKVAPGWNTRVFNTAEVAPPADSSISIDTKTGYITLKRGTYYITAS